MTAADYRCWLFAVDQALAELVDSAQSTPEDENFFQLWWKDLRESWSWQPLCRCGRRPAQGRALCERCLEEPIMEQRA